MNDLSHNLAGRHAAVTGAGSGIGRATAMLLGKAGARVALIGRKRDELEDTRRELGPDGGHICLVADVGEEDQMIRAFEEIRGKFGRLDIVIPNAGINGTWAPLTEIKVDEWDRTMAINLRGTFLTVKLALPLLKVSGHGAVVIVSSINGTRVFSNSGATAYSCSKAAQVAFAKMTALELAKDNIRVNVVCPGAIKTRIDDSTERKEIDNLHLPVVFPEGDVPLTGGKPGSADQVAKLIWFLASDLSNHITGTEIYIEGAQSLLQG